MTSGFQYFEKDGAYFRKRKSLNLAAIEHVRHGDRWVPYKGDRCKPYMFGDEVSEEEATRGMGSGAN